MTAAKRTATVTKGPSPEQKSFRPPFGGAKGGVFFDRKRATAARRAARRRARGKRCGQRSWMRSWPTLNTQKGGKNAGKAPRYDARPYRS